MMDYVLGNGKAASNSLRILGITSLSFEWLSVVHVFKKKTFLQLAQVAITFS